MPPKAKKPDAKKHDPIEDESGIPKNEVTFKFNFQVKQNEIENMLVMVEWITSHDTAVREKLDTDLIECWNQPNPEDPTLLDFEMELPSVRVEDKFAKNICSNKFYVYFVSAEDQCIKDTYYLNYSPLLTAKGEPKFEFYHDKVKIPEIEHFRMTITADKELLTPLFRDFLNPLEICIIGAKEMPNNNSGYNKNEPVYVQAKFFDGTIIKTHDLPHASTCKWMYKQVILVGLMDHVKLMEDLKSIPLQFEVHDQDEVAKNQIREFKQLVDIKYEEPEPPVEVIDPKAKGGKGAAAKAREKTADPAKKKDDKAKDAKDAKAKDPKAKDAKGKKDAKKKKDIKSFEPIKQEDTREFMRGNYGISSFNLNDLLNPHANSLKLRNYIVPIQKFENKDSRNLDLNTTARRELQQAHIACDYLSNESYLVVTFEIAHGIRPFKKPVAQPEANLPIIDQKAVNPTSKQAAKPSVPQPKDNKKDAAKGEVPVKVEVPEEKPIFERAVYIFPYKSPELTTRLLSIIQDINMAAFGQEDANPLFLTTKALSEEERKNRNLDIITGLEFIDNEYRTFIIEGLADKGMKKLEEEFPKTQPNSREIKILKNPDFKFKERLYLDFNIDVKKIKLRENLAKLLIKPEIYLRSKVPENIYNILVTFSEVRRCDNMKGVIASNLFPDVENTISMERKYGDALTDEDINGKEGPPQKIVSRTAAKLTDMASDLGLSNIQSTTSRRAPVSKSKRLSPETSQTLEKPGDLKEINIRSLSTKLATRVDNPKHERYTLHMAKEYPLPQGEEVYTSAGTKLNVYERQKAELREIARNDPNHFYTYSADYLSLSIDPYAPEDIKRIENETKQKMWKTPEGFQTILKKNRKDYIIHPKKPHQSKVDELTKYPWHQDKLEQTKKLANSRGEPIRNGPDFRTQIGKIDFFSSPEIVEAENITAVEKERQLKEAKNAEEEAWKTKVIVENPYFYTSLCTNKNSQLDKIKSVREGEAKKLGLIMKDTRLKATTLGTTKTIQENPISMYLTEEWNEQGNKNLFERQLDTQKAVSDYDFKTNIKQSNQYNMIYKPVKEIFN